MSGCSGVMRGMSIVESLPAVSKFDKRALIKSLTDSKITGVGVGSNGVGVGVGVGIGTTTSDRGIQ
jgi:hypothetical protein